ncbi:cytochrome c oxidase accessory protein CcoG [Chitiniphilus eburneus]|uniref:Cytochrome c oxidase accessory protein CcoG n=1 Tax=Chitiniphilus eburneus TaxID=2571148 RepID=A0A4U0QCH7_9NEIS|nr:cytochrome c oxidase accessory protein CcoG [Chitiniphilus eburneus]TJZ73534.1 cytochrome c oxidase accessory protein CcoG [Chitiniphilus eburneus]
MSQKLQDIPVTVVQEKDDGEYEEIHLYAKHKKIYPRWINGFWNKWRIFFVFATQLFFYGMPWLTINDRQALLFDLATRKFYILGLVFLPQDFIYLTALLITCAIGLFAWTTIGGRLWCGYACPQTVYTEIFLWIEKWVEGDRMQRIKLDSGPATPRKIRLKVTKHLIWVVFALWTGFTFVGYFTPIHELGRAALNLGVGPWETFWILFYGFATYGNAGWMREQVCKYMCPYARFQSVMFDADTLIVSYDTERGEARGHRKKGADYRAAGLGDCIDCKMCVQVCPVGIDIREGLQYECIGCTACIDACDDVMDKMQYPRGLIRYTTQNALEHKYPESAFWSRLKRPRVIVYAVLLAIVLSVTVVSLVLRQPVKVNISRDRVALVRETDDGWLENSYIVQIENADENSHVYTIEPQGMQGMRAVVQGGNRIEVASTGIAEVGVRLQVPSDQAPKGTHEVKLLIRATDKPAIATEEVVTFINR